MNTIEINAKSLLRRQKYPDSWFLGACGMNIYRGCSHDCCYCDGRAEAYRVEGDFARDVQVKVNAPELIDRELDPARRRKPVRRGFVFLGGGVGDAYQPAEERYGLTRKVLGVIRRYGQPVHVLTKSVLVERDLDILKGMRKAAAEDGLFNNDMSPGAVVSFSFSTVDDDLGAAVEPGVPGPSRRLECLRRFKDEGIPCGVYLLPILPFLSDRPEQIAAVFEAAAKAGADFLVFGGLTLKEGRQKEHFLRRAAAGNPDIALKYDLLYPGDPYGNPRSDYYYMLNDIVFSIASHYRLPLRMPPRLFRNVTGENDTVAVMLEHMDFFHRARGHKTPYAWAAKKVRELDVPVSSLGNRVRSISGIGPAVACVIREILSSGTCPEYEKLLYGGM